MLTDLLTDESYREALAEEAYLRERRDDAAAASEFDEEPHAYYVVQWESLSDNAKRPYRTAVATSCDHLLGVLQRV